MLLSQIQLFLQLLLLNQWVKNSLSIYIGHPDEFHYVFNWNTLQMEHFLARKAAKDSALSNGYRIPWDSSKEPLIASFISLWLIIDQFRYNKIQPKTIDLSTRLWGINTEFVGFIPKSLVLRLIALGWILIYSVIYRNWSRERMHMTSWQLHWCSKTMKRRQCWCTKPTVGVQLLFFVNTFVCCNIFAWLSDTYSICEAQSMEFVTLSLRHVKFFF